MVGQGSQCWGAHIMSRMKHLQKSPPDCFGHRNVQLLIDVSCGFNQARSSVSFLIHAQSQSHVQTKSQTSLHTQLQHLPHDCCAARNTRCFERWGVWETPKERIYLCFQKDANCRRVATNGCPSQSSSRVCTASIDVGTPCQEDLRDFVAVVNNREGQDLKLSGEVGTPLLFGDAIIGICSGLQKCNHQRNTAGQDSITQWRPTCSIPIW